MFEKEYACPSPPTRKQAKKELRQAQSCAEQHAHLQASSGSPFDTVQRRLLEGEHLKGLEMINQNFAGRFRRALFGLMQRRTDISAEAILIQPYREFIAQLRPPASLNLVNLKPLRGNTLFAFTPGLIFTALDTLFGGIGRLPDTQEREFTPAENRVIDRLLKMMLQAYGDAWLRLHPLEPEYITAETSYLFTGFSDGEMVIISPFRVAIGGMQGEFAIIFSQATLEPLHEMLSKPLPGHICRDQGQWRQNLARQLQGTELELIARFADLPLYLSQVMVLRRGDILPIPRPDRDRLTAYVDGVPVFLGSYGSLNGQYALRVEHVINEGINQLNNKDISHE
ncbi:flagellar motor switch protein FliM [Sodalis-like endosymbiont of Proechinophthirus fluctus]|uniref:flagellar motor switch protein FliM n=1 Tax=Sodalis-like endosymbiont of Proechinophthirus fluctus TaxID=1462730 RepID=UPI00082A7F24|nr:flagellar motor switch protein FliM [Sodalis-like endosymbiont of Proechinophthirus fluctus]